MANTVLHRCCYRCRKPYETPRKTSRCAACMKEQRYQKARSIIEEFFSAGCIECGERRRPCLHAHHTNPGPKIERIADIARRSYTANRIRKELEGCVPLCANCHAMLHHEERGIPRLPHP